MTHPLYRWKIMSNCFKMTVMGMIQQDLANRITKRFSHLKKWARRSKVTCFRVYDKDIADYPLICDWYDGDVVAWIYDRKKDETPEQKDAFAAHVEATLCHAFDICSSRLFLKYRRRQTSFQYEKLSHAHRTKVVTESGLNFEVNLSDYLDTGLFLDHRDTREHCRHLSAGKRVLNCFSYTGSFSVYARSGGALSVTSVDMNKTYMAWAQRNFELNHFKPRGSDRFIVDNCLSFLKQASSHDRYDLIICDPPTFSDSKKMKHAFDINRDYADLIQDCLCLLSPEGHLIFSTNSRTFKLDASRLPSSLDINDISNTTTPPDFKGKYSHACWIFS